MDDERIAKRKIKYKPKGKTGFGMVKEHDVNMNKMHILSFDLSLSHTYKSARASTHTQRVMSAPDQFQIQ
jgi:phosphopantetheinyl transferase (holo-ACP synthase)